MKYRTFFAFIAISLALLVLLIACGGGSSGSGNVDGDYDGDGLANDVDNCPYDPSSDCSLWGPLVIDEVCTLGAQCSSGVCEDDGTGTLRCQQLSGCQPVQELCEFDTDCCSEVCTLFPGTSLGRCEDPPGCQYNGELCGVGYSNNCCSGGAVACVDLISSDISRCFTDSTGGLLSSTADCAFDEECNSGVCEDNGGGDRTCQ